MPLQWYVVRTKPHAERAASSGLERFGFQVFAPYVRARLPKGSHPQVPLFPGYLFLQCDMEERGWPLLGHLPHVFGLVQFGGMAPAVPDEVIHTLARRVEEINGIGGLWTQYRPGEKVQVRLGATENLAEVVAEPKSPHSRVRVLMEFLGRRVYADVPGQYIRPARDHTYLGIESPAPAPRRTRGRGRWIRGFGPRAERRRPQNDNGQTSS
jgi:transcriptional antiterminator RfaH